MTATELSTSMRVFRADDLNLYENRTVLKIPFEGMEGAWIIVSFGSDGHREQTMKQILDKFGPELFVHAVTTFLFDSGEIAAEWEPQYGPITIWEKCGSDWESEGEYPRKARKHWFYEWVKDIPGNWSQLAVDREGLKEKLLAGQLDQIFDTLKSWAIR